MSSAAERVESGVDQIDDSRITLGLREMEYCLPEELVRVNGRAFRVALDEERLRRAVNLVAEDSDGPSLNPKLLLVGLGDQLPPPSPRVGLNRETGGTTIDLTIPREVRSAAKTAEVAGRISGTANRDLLTALGQNLKAKHSFSFGWRLSSVYLAAMAAGESGVALADTDLARLDLGAGGAVIGGFVATSLIVIRQEMKTDHNDGGYDAMALRSAQPKVQSPAYYPALGQMQRAEPIIFLESVRKSQAKKSKRK